MIQANLLSDLQPVLEGWADPVAFGVGHDGAIYAAARRNAAEALSVQMGIGVFPKSRLDCPVDLLVVRSDGRGVRTMTVRDISVVVTFVQPFDGGVLLVGGRCHWRPEGPEQNALVVNWNGEVERAFTLGDGIEDVRVTADGDLWVSYFDEGVFGNFGWGNPGPEPMGVSGLVRFDRSGVVQFTYDAAAARTDSICDAYAINLAQDGKLWVYFYTEFPLVCIDGAGYRAWRMGLAGAGALAVREDRALLFGDYKRRTLGRIVALHEDEATVVEEVQIDGVVGRTKAYGRGESLFLFEDRRALVVRQW